ncbi:hypothetical protein BKA70DRAFT_1452314 [Coprinopsis sp. MPI-PUGE-AT-0042]|nr:hypothetical protein BKA70DRAFT_1452314 [Coprinopsis sp. MPI-PUGE-AT-0042]
MGSNSTVLVAPAPCLGPTQTKAGGEAILTDRSPWGVPVRIQCVVSIISSIVSAATTKSRSHFGDIKSRTLNTLCKLMRGINITTERDCQPTAEVSGRATASISEPLASSSTPQPAALGSTSTSDLSSQRLPNVTFETALSGSGGPPTGFPSVCSIMKNGVHIYTKLESNEIALTCMACDDCQVFQLEHGNVLHLLQAILYFGWPYN